MNTILKNEVSLQRLSQSELKSGVFKRELKNTHHTAVRILITIVLKLTTTIIMNCSLTSAIT